jgi:hypothetical protein
VSSETPAAHLARLKVTYQSWALRAVEPTGYAAHRRDGRRSIHAATLGELENRLADEETRRAQS